MIVAKTGSGNRVNTSASRPGSGAAAFRMGLRGPERGCRAVCGPVDEFSGAFLPLQPLRRPVSATNPPRRRSVNSQAGARAIPPGWVLKQTYSLHRDGLDHEQASLANQVHALDQSNLRVNQLVPEKAEQKWSSPPGVFALAVAVSHHRFWVRASRVPPFLVSMSTATRVVPLGCRPIQSPMLP